jgi:transketolase
VLHAGLTLGEDGATHQILEDIGLMKMLPGMTVIHVITTKPKQLL